MSQRHIPPFDVLFALFTHDAHLIAVEGGEKKSTEFACLCYYY